jgi:pimeloyl-ACP methyl ester carboxylesterase
MAGERCSSQASAIWLGVASWLWAIRASLEYGLATRIGGPEIGALAESYWTNPTVEGRAVYIQRCMPFYRHRRDRPAEPMRAIIKDEVAIHFNGPANELGRFNFHDDLAKVECPVLMIAGEHDPIVPISLAEATASSLPSHLIRFERLANCGHSIHGDDPDTVFSLIREFITDGRITAAA